MINDAGLIVSKEINTYCEVDDTEFNNSYSHVPLDIGNFLRAREDGNIYQFVWELKFL